MVSFMINTVTEIFSEAAMFIVVAIFTVASGIKYTARFSDMKDAALIIPTRSYPSSSITTTVLS